MSEFSHEPESLAKRLDQVLPPGQFDAPRTTGDPLIDAAAMFAQSSAPQLSNEAMERIQARILSIHQAQDPVQQILTPQTQSQQARLLTGSFARGLMRWGAVASFVCIVLLLGLTPAIANSLPGELFYPAKQAIEQAELNFAQSPEARAVVHLQHAERRANEALALLERGQFKPELVEQALQDMRSSAEAARANGDSSTLIALRGRTLQVDTALSFIMSEAQQIDVAFAATIAPLATDAQITRENGALLLSTPTLTSTPLSEPTNTAEVVPEATATPPLDTQAPTEPTTQRPTTAPSTATFEPIPQIEPATLQPLDFGQDDQLLNFPVAVVVEGIVDSVDTGSIVVDGIPFSIEPEIDVDLLVTGKPVALTVTFDAAGTMIVSEIGQANDMNAGRDDLHPIGVALAGTFDVPYDAVMALAADGQGFGNLTRAYLLSSASGVDVEMVLSLHDAEMSWAEIMRQVDLTPSNYANGRVVGRGHVARGLGQQQLALESGITATTDFGMRGSSANANASSQSDSQGGGRTSEPPANSQPDGNSGNSNAGGNSDNSSGNEGGNNDNSNSNAGGNGNGNSGGNGNGNSGGNGNGGNGNGGGNGNDD